MSNKSEFLITTVLHYITYANKLQCEVSKLTGLDAQASQTTKVAF